MVGVKVGTHTWAGMMCDSVYVHVYTCMLTVHSCSWFRAGDTPVYKVTKRREQFSMEQLAKIVILESVKESQICSRQPTNVARNCAFVVNLHSLECPTDVRADDNGVWIRGGSPVTYVSVHGSTSIVRRTRMRNFPNHYKLVRVYYRHADSPDFRRIITTAEGIAA